MKDFSDNYKNNLIILKKNVGATNSNFSFKDIDII